MVKITVVRKLTMSVIVESQRSIAKAILARALTRSEDRFCDDFRCLRCAGYYARRGRQLEEAGLVPLDFPMYSIAETVVKVTSMRSAGTDESTWILGLTPNCGHSPGAFAGMAEDFVLARSTCAGACLDCVRAGGTSSGACRVKHT